MIRLKKMDSGEPHRLGNLRVDKVIQQFVCVDESRGLALVFQQFCVARLFCFSMKWNS